jgi:hypothetical protein
VTHGPALFGRYAFPPNVLGYCGPSDAGLSEGLISAEASTELARVVQQFEGAWPYLELIGGCTGRDPLDVKVVEAYWIGNDLLDQIDTLVWGNSVDDRFRSRAGESWSALNSGIVEGRPNHAFHVFCVYPWVGLLQVVETNGSHVIVESRPLVWDGEELTLGALRRETVRQPVLGSGCDAGDTVALHWDYVCETLNPGQLDNLKHETRLHLELANRPTRDLATVIER